MPSVSTRSFPLALAASSLSLPGVVHAAVINVPGDQPSIQRAIDVAKSDEVVVAPGTYNELIDFAGKRSST